MRIYNLNKIRLRWRAAGVVRPSHTTTLYTSMLNDRQLALAYLQVQ